MTQTAAFPDLDVYHAHLRRRGITPGTEGGAEFGEWLAYWRSKRESGREAERAEIRGEWWERREEERQ